MGMQRMGVVISGEFSKIKDFTIGTDQVYSKVKFSLNRSTLKNSDIEIIIVQFLLPNLILSN